MEHADANRDNLVFRPMHLISVVDGELELCGFYQSWNVDHLISWTLIDWKKGLIKLELTGSSGTEELSGVGRRALGDRLIAPSLPSCLKQAPFGWEAAS